MQKESLAAQRPRLVWRRTWVSCASGIQLMPSRANREKRARPVLKAEPNTPKPEMRGNEDPAPASLPYNWRG
jgi:hypothetical protein